MKRKILVVIVILALFMSSTISAFGFSDHPDANRDALRVVVAQQATAVTGLVTGLLPEATLKGLIKNAISDYVNIGDLANLAGPALAEYLESAIKDALGTDLPAGIDIEKIINDVLNNQTVTSILNSEFVGKVIDRTVDNLLDTIVIDDVVAVLTESVIDKLTDELWNNGNPSRGSLPFIGQTGIWHTNGTTGWIPTNIGIQIALKLGISGATGGIENYVDTGAIDITKLVSTDAIIGALTKAVKDTIAEYWATYKPILVEKAKDLIAKAKVELDNLKATAMADLIAELNRILGMNASPQAELAGIEAASVAHVESKTWTNEQIDCAIADLNALKGLVNKVEKFKCLDLSKVNACIDRLIRCLESKRPPIVVDPILVSVDPSAVVEKLNGNKNNLTITIVGTYSDGSTKVIAVQTFSIDNNAADTYDVAGYKVYVDTKGNVQIRACYIVT